MKMAWATLIASAEGSARVLIKSDASVREEMYTGRNNLRGSPRFIRLIPFELSPTYECYPRLDLLET